MIMIFISFASSDSLLQNVKYIATCFSFDSTLHSMGIKFQSHSSAAFYYLTKLISQLPRSLCADNGVPENRKYNFRLICCTSGPNLGASWVKPLHNSIPFMEEKQVIEVTLFLGSPDDGSIQNEDNRTNQSHSALH